MLACLILVKESLFATRQEHAKFLQLTLINLSESSISFCFIIHSLFQQYWSATMHRDIHPQSTGDKYNRITMLRKRVAQFYVKLMINEDFAKALS